MKCLNKIVQKALKLFKDIKFDKLTNLKTMKRTCFYCMIVWMFITSQAFAQSGKISGFISDKLTQNGLQGATIRSGSDGVLSDENGRYTLILQPGEHEIEVSFVGYFKQTRKITLTQGQTIELNFILEENVSILQTTTVTAGKYETPLAESTVSLEVVKPSLIESVNANTVDEVLNKIPSVNIIDGQANIRGGSGFSYGAGSRVLLLVDDMPALQVDAGYTNWADVPVENIEQIEVVKGAASALYGSAALNGIINIRTGYAKSKPVTKAAIFATTLMNPGDNSQKWWDTPPVEFGAQFLHKQKFDKLDVVIGGFYSGGDQYIKDTYNRYTRLNTGLRYRVNSNLSISLNTNINSGTSRSFFLWKNMNEGAWVGDTNTVAESKKLRFFIDPSVLYFDKFGNKHKIMGRWNSVDNNNLNNQSNQSNSLYAEYQFQRDLKMLGIILTAGITETYSKISAELYGNADFSVENRAAYLQLDKKFGPRLTISTGARYEYNSIKVPESILRDTFNTEAKPVFRAGINYKLGEATYVRSSFGQGYRFPTIAEKFIQTNFSSFQIFPNDTLKSETGWSGELGIKQGFKISDWYGFIDVAGFWTEYKDMMEFTLSAGAEGVGFRALNIGNTIIKGFDIGIAAQGQLFGLPTSLFSGYTYLDPKFATFGPKEMQSSSRDDGLNILKYRFRHSVKFDAESKYKGFSIGAAFIYNSNMDAIDRVFNVFIKDVKAFREKHDNGFAIMDVRMSYSPFNSFKTTLIVGNIFNTIYSWRPGRLESPRNITLRLDYTFN